MRADPRPSYRRAEHLVCYWESNRFVVHNYATAARIAVDPLLLRVLACADVWKTADQVARTLRGVDADMVQRTLDELHRCSLLVRANGSQDGRSRALRDWKGWMPEAAFFHFAIRDTEFTPPEIADRALRDKAAADPPPAGVKVYRREPVVSLPSPSRSSPLAHVLLRRRTWRRFGRGGITAAHLATLLDLTWGVQHWAQPGTRAARVALKTAPSGGARHSIEAYVLVRRVRGIAPGLYHYDPDGHRLRRLARRRTVPQITDYVPHQTWYRPAAALVLMTAVFARAQWRYPYSRAYRSVLFEAGHHCQNFLLLATSLGLAPFCTGALADSRIESDLGIDGASEGVLYACGVGARPAGVEWGPWPDPASTPTLFPPRARTRRAAR